jgi:hypothetical protein
MLSSSAAQGSLSFPLNLRLPSTGHSISLCPDELRASFLLVTNGASRDIYILACEIVTIFL